MKKSQLTNIQSILLNNSAAAGGVGIAAIQVAKQIGAEVWFHDRADIHG